MAASGFDIVRRSKSHNGTKKQLKKNQIKYISTFFAS